MKEISKIINTPRGKKLIAAMFFTALACMCVFSSYEFIRSPAESIFIEHFGAARKPWAIACVPFAMLALIYCYSWALARIGSKKTMLASMGISGLFMLLAWYFVNTAGAWLAFLLLVFKEAYVVIISEQFWSFINSTLKDEESKIFNGPVAGLSAFGSVIGAYTLTKYIHTLGTDNFLLVAGLLLIPGMLFCLLAYNIAGEPKPELAAKKEDGSHFPVRILWENKTVMFIGLTIFCCQVVSTALDFRWTQLVQDFMSDKDAITAYMGGFWMHVNMFSALMQFIAAPFILRYVPRRFILGSIPALHICMCASLFIFPSLGLASAAYMLFKGLDYSLFRASKETLYIPMSYDVRFRAKQIADAFMYRFAKGVTATSVTGLQALTALSSGFYPALAAIFAGIWFALSFPLTASRPAEYENSGVKRQA